MTTVKINTGCRLLNWEHGGTDPNKIRQFIVQCISAATIGKKPTQAKISKDLKKIKNDETDLYYNRGYILVEVNVDGILSYYAYSGDMDGYNQN